MITETDRKTPTSLSKETDPKTPALLSKYATCIDHIAIAVNDLETSIAWYRDLLGFKFVERRKTEGKKTGMVSAVMNANGIDFVLIQGTSPESQVSRYVEHYGPGVQHVAIGVDDLEAVVADLTEAGFDFGTTIIRSPGLHQIFSKRDQCSGMMIELIQRVEEDASFNDIGVQQLFDQLENSDLF